MASHEETRVFYLCNGEVPYCGKHMCYKGKKEYGTYWER